MLKQQIVIDVVEGQSAANAVAAEVHACRMFPTVLAYCLAQFEFAVADDPDVKIRQLALLMRPYLKGVKHVTFKPDGGYEVVREAPR